MSDRPKRATISENIGSDLGAFVCVWVSLFIFKHYFFFVFFSVEFIFYFVIIIHFRSVNWYSKFLISDGQSTSLDTAVCLYPVSADIVALTISTIYSCTLHVYLHHHQITINSPPICFSFFSLFISFAVCWLPRKMFEAISLIFWSNWELRMFKM